MRAALVLLCGCSMAQAIEDPEVDSVPDPIEQRVDDTAAKVDALVAAMALVAAAQEPTAQEPAPELEPEPEPEESPVEPDGDTISELPEHEPDVGPVFLADQKL